MKTLHKIGDTLFIYEINYFNWTYKIVELRIASIKEDVYKFSVKSGSRYIPYKMKLIPKGMYKTEFYYCESMDSKEKCAEECKKQLSSYLNYQSTELEKISKNKKAIDLAFKHTTASIEQIKKSLKTLN